MRGYDWTTYKSWDDPPSCGAMTYRLLVGWNGAPDAGGSHRPPQSLQKKRWNPRCGKLETLDFWHFPVSHYTPEVWHSPWKMMVGRLVSFWEGNLAGAMFTFRWVKVLDYTASKVTHANCNVYAGCKYICVETATGYRALGLTKWECEECHLDRWTSQFPGRVGEISYEHF